MYTLIEGIAFILPSVLAHIYGNFWIAHVMYTGYFIAHKLGLAYKYKQFKNRNVADSSNGEPLRTAPKE